MTVANLIDQSVERFGPRIALVDDARSVTYAQLGARTAQLASALAKVGVDRDSCVGVVMGNRSELVEVDFACARFAITRSMMNVRGTPEDFAHALGVAEARAVFFDTGQIGNVDPIRADLPGVGHWICVGDDCPDWAEPFEDFLATGDETCPLPLPTMDDRHSIYFTSGTTGKPKGVALTQQNWCNLVVQFHLNYPPQIEAEDVALLAAPLTHASCFPLLPLLSRGAKCRILPDFEPERFLREAREIGATHSFLSPTMVMMLMDCGTEIRREDYAFKCLLCGGASFPQERIREAMDTFGPVIVMGYGQWESPSAVSVMTQADYVEALERAPHRLTSAGRPGMFFRNAIMDEDGNVLGPNQTGEVVTSGAHLMDRYLGDPRLTEDIRVGPWQRTGDMGHIDEDGFLYITDRKKDMIITGGNNVYPRQIEEVLYQHPCVKEVSVVGKPHMTWGETVHAVVVARDGCEIDPDAFMLWAREKLPTDRRPRSVDVVADLPKSNYGKILKSEIRRLYGGRTGP